MQDLIFEKRCSRCGEIKSVDCFGVRVSRVKKIERRDSWCKACYAEHARNYDRRDQEKRRRRERARYAARSLEDRRRCNARENERRLHLKVEVMNHYGGAFCACCGENEITMLTLDHIDGDGADHRRQTFGIRNAGGKTIYGWARRNGYPPIFQVLCMNCNWARHWNNGVCPHQEQRLALAA